MDRVAYSYEWIWIDSVQWRNLVLGLCYNNFLLRCPNKITYSILKFQFITKFTPQTLFCLCLLLLLYEDLCTALMRPHLQCCFQVWTPWYKTDVDILDWDQQRAVKRIKGLEYLSCEEKLKRLTLFNLEKRRLGEAYRCVQIADGME